MISEFFVKGTARPVSRPRVFTSHGITRAVRNPKDVSWEKDIIDQVISQNPHYFSREIPLKVVCFSFYERPQKSKYKEAISRDIGDNDNWLKGILDALQTRTVKIGKLRIKQKGLCFDDDAQIVRLVGQKFYTKAKPFVIIRVTDEIDNRECEWL